MSTDERFKRCKYFVQRKNRTCKMIVRDGQNYCGEHLAFDSSLKEIRIEKGKGLKRILCPLDRKHSVYEDKLEKHLKICNSRQKSQPAYIMPGINRGEDYKTEQCKKLAEILQEEITALIEKINAVYEKCLPHAKKEILTNSLFLEELSNAEYGPTKMKHLTQNASLLSHAENARFCEEETAFIEFGAGRGQMSYYVAQKMLKSKSCLFLLVDRASQKHKFDNKLKFSSSVKIERIRGDIADLSLQFFAPLQPFRRITSVSKHLCGAATDYALRCLANHQLPMVSFVGILLSFCCHHRCDWGSYTGKEFMKEQGFTPENFKILCSISSWATCGFGRGSEKQDSECIVESSGATEFTDEERKTIGRKVKHILNYGRQKYLEGKGFKCQLIEYVEETISPENICILAKKEVNNCDAQC